MECFHVAIYSDYEEFWRYNLIVMSDATGDGESHELLKARSDVAPIGASLLAPPKDYNPERRIELHHATAKNLTLYIYVLPHTMPLAMQRDGNPSIADVQPFGLRVEVLHGDRVCHAHTHEVDQWAGATIQLSM